jgi:hypothetical protein
MTQNRKQTKAQADYEAYLKRCAELHRRIADGETITEIMRAEQLERGKARIAEILEQDHQERGAFDPRAALGQLGSVIWSDDFDAYAGGKIDASQIHCALCQCAPCRCPAFGTPAYFALINQRHGRTPSGASREATGHA